MGQMPTQIHAGFLLSSVHGGGAERMLQALANGLSRRGHRITVFAANGRGKSTLLETVRLEVIRGGRARYGLRQLAEFVERERPDVVLATQWHMNLLAIAATAGRDVPVVLRLANVAPERSIRKTSFTRALKANCAPWACRRATALVAVSRGVAQSFIQSFDIDPRKICVIYNGPISQRFYRRLAEPLPARFSHVDGSQALIVSVGRLVPQKNHAMLLQSFAALRRDAPAKLLVIGDGPEMKRLKLLSHALGVHEDVLFAGHVENPMPLLKLADVFALSSNYEGLPSALIEAVAAGCEVVSTECAAGPAEILRDGKVGWLVNVGDAEAFASALRQALFTSRRRNSEPAAALERFSERLMVANYEALLTKLVARRVVPPNVSEING